ncbi:MAG: hypothetical protein GH155_04675 [Spirochaeta sp.]|nr:hypothetical protein [Spirochaeta sp.]
MRSPLANRELHRGHGWACRWFREDDFGLTLSLPAGSMENKRARMSAVSTTTAIATVCYLWGRGLVFPVYRAGIFLPGA